MRSVQDALSSRYFCASYRVDTTYLDQHGEKVPPRFSVWDGNTAFVQQEPLENMAGKRPAGRESEAPRVTTLLRAVQRGDYGVLTSLLGSSNGCEEPWSLPLVCVVLIHLRA